MRLSDPGRARAAAAVARRARETLPPATDLNELFEQLRGPALATVFAWLAEMQNAERASAARERRGAARVAEHRGAGAADRIARDRGVALEAVRRAGALKTPAAVAPLAKALADGDAPLRARGRAGARRDRLAGRLQALERAHRRRRPRRARGGGRARYRRAAHRPALREARGDREGQARCATPT